MPESKRQCSTCKFFQNAQLSGNGWCTHPKRQVASDVKILVRERELACRNTWGDDLWIDALSNTTTPDIAPPARREFTYLNTKLDDEVTSVVDSGAISRPAGTSQDDVVTFTSVRPDETHARSVPTEHDVNSAAVADQEERAREIRKGSRHAIDSARARHARRWAPAQTEDEVVPGNTAQVEPSVTEDHVINADHRPARSAPAPFGDDQFEATGPVPRAEIEAHGALPPLPDSDPEPVRPAPKVTAGIDLPRLRNFLRPDEGQASTPTHTPAAASSQPAATSNYEHVIRQAERIKALSKSERVAHNRSKPNQSPLPVRQPESRPAPTPTPAPEPEITRTQESRVDDVVWDTDKGELNMTFARARAAIDQRPIVESVIDESVEPLQSQPELTILEEAVEAFDFAVEPTIEAELDPVAETAFEPGEIDERAFEVETDGSYVEDLVVDEMEPLEEWEYDEFWEDETDEPIAAEAVEPYVEQPAPPARRDSPRGSWWRSLNFGLKRRYVPDPEPVEPAYQYDDVEPLHTEYLESGEPDLSYDEVTGDGQYADDDLYWHESPTEPAGEEAWWPEEILEDEVFEEALPLAAERQESAGSHLTTSDESWLMDAREFPAPQPAEWHQSRTELLAQRPEIEPTPQARPERREPVDHLEWIEPRAATPRREERAPARRRPEPREYIPIDQPSGMDAFRDALFGGAASNGLVDAPATRAARFTAPPSTFDEVEYATAPREARWEPMAENVEPEPARWEEADVEPISARPARREPAPERENRRDRSNRSSRGFERRDDEIFDIRRAVADPDDVSITRQLDAESGVAKCCLTCRSFQPGDEAGRGWCMNSWAGTYRQMVNADTLACQSSIGNWWIAADTTWIPPSDSIQPRTPRTDRLVARAESHDERESSKRSRVRTGKVG